MTPDKVTALFRILEAGYAPIAGKPGYSMIKNLERNIAGIVVEIIIVLGWLNHGIIIIIMEIDKYKSETFILFLSLEFKPPPYDTTIPRVVSTRI